MPSRDKDKQRAAQRRCMARVLEVRRQLLFELKMRPCAECGLQWPPPAMDFDHRPGEVKKFNLSSIASHNLEAIVAEAAKCDVVCACCHRLRTHQRRLK